MTASSSPKLTETGSISNATQSRAKYFQNYTKRMKMGQGIVTFYDYSDI